MKRKLANLSLRKKILFIFGCLVVLMVIIPCSILYQHYYGVFRQNVTESLEVAVSGNAEKLRVLTDTVLAAVRQVNDNQKAYISVGEQELSPVADMITRYGTEGDDTNLYELINEMNMNKDLLEDIFATASGSIQGKMSYALIVSGEYPIAKYLGLFRKGQTNGLFRSKGVEERDWYQKTLERDGDIYWFCQEEYPGRVFMAKLLQYQYLDREYHYEIRKLGVMLVSFDVSWVAKQIDTAEITQETLFFIMDEEGNLLYDNQGQEETFTGEEIALMLENAGEEKSSLYEHGQRQYLIQRNAVNQGLFVLTIVPFGDIQVLAFDMVKTILVVMIVIFVLGSILAALLSKVLMKPILGLAFQMKKGVVEQIDGYQERKDEIGILYQGYNQLQQRIQELIEEAWDSAEKEKRAQIHALQMQMNPHFIYNSLGAISCNALLCGQDQIAEQITALSAIIRYNVKNPDAMVSLKEEISMITCYEEIWKVSYEDSLLFEHDVMPECEEAMIPKLMIQPLVENAILHGVDFTKGPGKIVIRAAMEADDRLMIRVANNGRKVDTEKINFYIRGACELDTDKNSLGVRNVYDRIKMFFGEDGELRYERDADDNTEAVISILVKEQL